MEGLPFTMPLAIITERQPRFSSDTEPIFMSRMM